jgi:hypothetical protein
MVDNDAKQSVEISNDFRTKVIAFENNSGLLNTNKE